MISTAIALLTLANPGKTELVLTGFDPIDLIAGKEVKGQEEYAFDYLRYHYRFSSKDHRDTFAQDPEKYAVQDGGACGKMGPLTGKGSPNRFAVVKGRIYLFASDGCRAGFLNNPEPYFGGMPAILMTSADRKKEAHEWWQKAKTAHGVTGTLPVIQMVTETRYQQDGKDLLWISRDTFVNSSTFATWWGDLKDPEFFVVKDNTQNREGTYASNFAVAPSEQRSLRASFLRHPVGILGAEQGAIIAPLSWSAPGFHIFSHSISAEVHLNEKTNQIESVNYYDRHSGPYAKVEIRFKDYKKVDGVLLPMTTETKVNDGDWRASSVTRYEVGIPVPELFTKAFQ